MAFVSCRYNVQMYKKNSVVEKTGFVCNFYFFVPFLTGKLIYLPEDFQKSGWFFKVLINKQVVL